MIAPLSYTSQFGYYGLRLNPTFAQVEGTVRKPLRVPLPSRMAKWEALSPYRALILDAQARSNDYEHAVLDYRQSGAQLNEAAARVRPSDAGEDPMFDELDRQHHEREAREAFHTAQAAAQEEAARNAAEARSEHLRHAYGPNRMDPMVEASHEELAEAGVPHAMPGPRIAPASTRGHAPPPMYSSAGQPQAPEFPSFEVLNQGQPPDLRRGNLRPSQNLTYEQARDFVVEPTWSS
jgi:hypothetical protein